MDYFISPSPDSIDRALDSWAWIGIGSRKVIAVTAFADVFFQSDDGIWFLDTLRGELQHAFQTNEEFKQVLATEEGQDHYLFAAFVDRAIREEGQLDRTQCLDFKFHPSVGGPVDYSNVERSDFVVALNLRGQLHEQIRDLPPGTAISGFTFKDESQKPWWKFW